MRTLSALRACAALAVLVCCGALSCGLKTPPRSPADVAPHVIGDLAATSTTEGIQLTWGRPTTYADGSRMSDLGGFVIERADDPAAPFQQVLILEVTDRDRFRQIKHFHQLDRDTTVGAQYRYRVVSFTLDRYFSSPSNVVTVERTSADEEKHAPLPTPRG